MALQVPFSKSYIFIERQYHETKLHESVGASTQYVRHLIPLSITSVGILIAKAIMNLLVLFLGRQGPVSPKTR